MEEYLIVIHLYDYDDGHRDKIDDAQTLEKAKEIKDFWLKENECKYVTIYKVMEVIEE